MHLPIVIITGPTASGKSGIALSLAGARDGVIINADSQQLYRELRILTARPTPEEEAQAAHRLYGVLPASEAGSAGKWLRLAKMEIDWTLAQGRLPIIVGGTGMYIKGLLEGMAEIPEIPAAVRQQAENDFTHMGQEAFAERLREVDPAFFTRLTVQDRQRLVRAYSVWLGSGKPLSWWQQQKTHSLYPVERFAVFSVLPEREQLYLQCDARFDTMLAAGAIDEVKALNSLKLDPSLPAMKSVGVPEITAYLDGHISLEAAKLAAQQATRNYAKRQLTWMRNQLPQATVIASSADILKQVDLKAPKH